MSKSLAITIGLILLAALLLFSMTYTVNYHEVAIKTRFGQINDSSVVKKPGLQFRLPLFADKVTTYDTRLQVRESPLETVQTSDGQQVMVKAYLLWQVDKDAADGPVKFFQSYSSVDEANASLTDQFKTAMRSGLSKFAFNDLIGAQSKLGDAESAIRSEMMAVQSKGIKPVSVGVSQLILPPRTAQAVLNRMQATRAVLSEAERNKGTAQAASIRNRAQADSEKIKAFADQRAAEIRAAGEQTAATYYTQMAEAQDLAIFLEWLDAWRATMSKYATVILPVTAAPIHLTNLAGPVDDHGIPQPPTTRPDIAGVEPTPAGAQAKPASGAADGKIAGKEH